MFVRIKVKREAETKRKINKKKRRDIKINTKRVVAFITSDLITVLQEQICSFRCICFKKIKFLLEIMIDSN